MGSENEVWNLFRHSALEYNTSSDDISLSLVNIWLQSLKIKFFQILVCNGAQLLQVKKSLYGGIKHLEIFGNWQQQGAWGVIAILVVARVITESCLLCGMIKWPADFEAQCISRLPGMNMSLLDKFFVETGQSMVAQWDELWWCGMMRWSVVYGVIVSPIDWFLSYKFSSF